MKKIILLLLITFCFILTGCSSNGQIATFKNSDGSIIEYYYIPFPKQELLANPNVNTTDIANIYSEIKTTIDAKMSSCLLDFASKVTQLETDDKTKQNILEKTKWWSSFDEENKSSFYWTNQNPEKFICYAIYFPNNLSYLTFKDANIKLKEENQERVITKNLFTTKTKIVKDPVFDTIANSTITLGQECVQTAKDILIRNLGKEWDTIKNQIGLANEDLITFDYSYVVPTKRIHSNANSITALGQNLYKHTWQVSIKNGEQENPIKIQYWITEANRTAWYVTSLILTACVIAGTYIYAKVKTKQDKSEDLNLTN